MHSGDSAKKSTKLRQLVHESPHTICPGQIVDCLSVGSKKNGGHPPRGNYQIADVILQFKQCVRMYATMCKTLKLVESLQKK